MGRARDVDARIRWSECELDRHRPVVAYLALWDLWVQLSPDERAEYGSALLEPALRICLKYFGEASPRTLQTAEALAPFGDNDPYVWSVLGVGLSLKARHIREDQPQEGWKLARQAEENLEKAIQLTPFDSTAWGSLGGLRSRMAEWSALDGETAASEEFERKALIAYRNGWDQGPDAYPALNYLEMRAAVACRNPAGRLAYLKHGSLCETDEERARLSEALDIRRGQAARQEDCPWSAFDVARGQQYMVPNVPRFLDDLDFAVSEAHRIARTSADRWMVQSAARTLQNLRKANVPLEGCEEGHALLQEAAAADDWVAGHWQPMSHAAHYLGREMSAVRAHLSSLTEGALSKSERQIVREFLERSEEKWRQEEEARFLEQVREESLAWEPPQKKALRVIWKLAKGVQVADIVKLTGLPQSIETAAQLVKAAISAVEAFGGGDDD